MGEKREKENNKSVITIKNYHLTPIKIIGYSIKKNKDSLILLPNPIELKEFNRKQTKKQKIEINAQVKNLYFKAENIPNKTLKNKRQDCLFFFSENLSEICCLLHSIVRSLVRLNFCLI